MGIYSPDSVVIPVSPEPSPTNVPVRGSDIETPPVSGTYSPDPTVIPVSPDPSPTKLPDTGFLNFPPSIGKNNLPKYDSYEFHDP